MRTIDKKQQKFKHKEVVSPSSLVEATKESLAEYPTAKLTVFKAKKGVMAKTFALDKDGKLTKQAPGKIITGVYNVRDVTLDKLQNSLRELDRKKAICLGTPRGNRESGNIVWTSKHKELGSPENPIPKNKEHFSFKGQPTLFLADVDGINRPIDEIIFELETIVPGLANAAKLIIHSSSAGLHSKSGKLLKDSTSAHIYVVVENGLDIERFTAVLFDRLWLNGLGHIQISAAGSMLQRAVIDQAVAKPERIIYEAPPVLHDGITQDRPESQLLPGGMLDTSLLADLDKTEQARLAKIITQAKEDAKPEAKRITDLYIEEQADKIVAENGGLKEDTVLIVKSRKNGFLDDGDVLFFADNNGKPVFVKEVLEHGEDYDGKALADPLEPDYDGGSLTKAKFYWNDGFSPTINTFAHGGNSYRFRRFIKPDKWIFSEVQTVLFSLDLSYVCETDKLDLASDILLHNAFDRLELDSVRNILKKKLDINKGAQDDVLKQRGWEGSSDSKSMSIDDDRTHWELANDYVSTHLISPGEETVGAEGVIWQYDESDGLFHPNPLTSVEDAVGAITGATYCKRGSDYKAITRLVYNKLLIEDFFDKAPYGIATDSGFIQISETGEIKTEGYRPEHRQRYKMLCDPVQEDAPLFNQYLADTFAGDELQQEVLLLQEIMGGIISGCFSKLQRALLLKGPGSNGKSVLLELLENMFPPGLKAAVPPNNFDNEYYRAMLAGKVVNIVGELDKSKSLRAVFKDIIGCDASISARMPYKEPFNFKPSAAHIFASNHFPQTKDHTHGFYRRWVILDFKNIVQDGKKIPNLGAKIAAEEMPQILAWALQGAERLARNKFVLSLTQSHERMLEHWKNTKDSVFSFLNDDEVVKRDPNARTPKKEVFAIYRDWCGDMGVRPVGYQEFCERCYLKYRMVKRSGERRCFDSLRLLHSSASSF